MLEVAGAGEHHGDVVLVGGLDRFVVADGAAGLNDRRCTHFGGGVNRVTERKEGIRREDERRSHIELGVLHLARGDLERIDALTGRDQTLGRVATVACIEQPCECPLVDLSNL